MPGSPQSETPLSPKPPQGEIASSSESAAVAGRSALEEPELEAALQLLVERAQYITGATGAALALPQGNEMVCHASAGSCAPAVGARLQVRSGLTGESIARRQLLRCDNAETDPRVNLEACQALGIASIVVLPLLRRSGEVRGLFELFSDHPYAFEERDLVALERMAALTQTALDLAEQRKGSVVSAPGAVQTPGQGPVKAPVQGPAQASAPIPPALRTAETSAKLPHSNSTNPGQPSMAAPVIVPPQEPHPTTGAGSASITATASDGKARQSPPVPEAMQRIQKCVSCGFPVSEGRTFCLDCEKKEGETKSGAKQSETKQVKAAWNGNENERKNENDAAPSSEPSAGTVYEDIPAFLANSVPVKDSWLSNHVNLLAILVLIAMVLVFVVVFR